MPKQLLQWGWSCLNYCSHLRNRLSSTISTFSCNTKKKQLRYSYMTGIAKLSVLTWCIRFCAAFTAATLAAFAALLEAATARFTPSSTFATSYAFSAARLASYLFNQSKQFLSKVKRITQVISKTSISNLKLS